MGMFGIIILVCIVVWAVAKAFKAPETEKCAEDVSARAVRGAHRVGKDLLGSVGGQGTPDFGRAVDEFEPEGDKVVRIDDPPTG